MKARLHFHSDCSFFAGCENMLVNFFASPELQAQYQVSFSFRQNPAYEAGLKKRVAQLPEHQGLALIDFDELNQKLKRGLPSFIHRCLSPLLYSLVKYFCVGFNTLKLFAFLMPKRIDIIHINNGGLPGAYSCYAAAFAAKILGIKQVLMVVNNMAVPYRHPSRYCDWPLDFLLKRCVDTFITGSHYAGQQLLQTLQLAPKRWHKIANGIKTRPIQTPAPEYRQRHGIPGNTILIGVIAVLETRKGHLNLLEAIKELGQKRSDFLLIIEGKGPQQAAIEQFIQKHQLQQRVRMLASENHIFDLINALDILVLPSLYNEDFPNIILEAMSLAKPVIASAIAGIPEQVLPGPSGLLVPPGEAQPLSQALEQLLDDQQLRHKLGSAGQRQYLELYTPFNAVNHYLRLYREQE